MAEPFAVDLPRPSLVLAGLSLGPESGRVLRMAVRLAHHVGGRVHVAHALEPPLVIGGATVFELAKSHLVARAQERLRGQLAGVAAPDCWAGVTAEIGAPGAVLCSVADRVGANVLVISSATAEPLPLHRVGSTVRHVLRRGARPVLVVKGEPRLPARVVLAPVDHSLLGADSLRLGLAHLTAGEAQVFPEVVVFNAADESGPESVRALREFAAQHLADYPGPVRCETRPGDPVAAILAVAERESPDLIILGTHGRSGWKRWRLGSVTDSVAAHASTSLLVVPPCAAAAGALAEAVGIGARSSE